MKNATSENILLTTKALSMGMADNHLPPLSRRGKAELGMYYGEKKSIRKNWEPGNYRYGATLEYNRQARWQGTGYPVFLYSLDIRPNDEERLRPSATFLCVGKAGAICYSGVTPDEKEGIKVNLRRQKKVSTPVATGVKRGPGRPKKTS